MDRPKATLLVQQLLARLVEGRGERPLSLITQVVVFGSYARGALTPHDVDLCVAHDHDEAWISHVIGSITYGRDPYTQMRKALRGNARSVQIMFEPLDRLIADYVVLWRAGDTLDAALQRLQAIPVDTNAGRAARDGMLPAFDGFDQWIPRQARLLLSTAHAAAAVTIEPVHLSDNAAGDRTTAEYIDSRWNQRNPRRRAAHAAIAYLEASGVPAYQVAVTGHPGTGRTHHVGLGWRGWGASLPWPLTETTTRAWLEVIHPTLTGRLDALLIIPTDHVRLRDLTL